MSITIRAELPTDLDYAAIRADGYQADITGDQCTAIAEVLEEEGLTAYPYYGEEESFYGSYVPAFGLPSLSEAGRAEVLRQFADNAEALRIVQKAITHGVQITFTRDCSDNQYRVRLVSDRADTVDMTMSGGSWTGFRAALGLDGTDRDSDIDCGELAVADVEKALSDSFASLAFSGEWHKQVAARLGEIVAYAKANGATSLVWA